MSSIRFSGSLIIRDMLAESCKSIVLVGGQLGEAKTFRETTEHTTTQDKL